MNRTSWALQACAEVCACDRTPLRERLVKTTCLNMFLNSLFHTSSTPSVWMNVSDTRKLDQTKRVRQSCSCSMEYFSFVYVYERHL